MNNWILPSHAALERDHGTWLLKYTGAKVPHKVSWDGDYSALHLHDQKAITTRFIGHKAKYSDGRFSALTKEFPHPAGCRTSSTGKAEEDRFKRDGGRFPLATYAAGNLLWTARHEAGGKWRTKVVVENEQLMGVPGEATAPLGTEQRRNTALGNAIHVPTLRLILWIVLAQVAPQCISAG